MLVRHSTRGVFLNVNSDMETPNGLRSTALIDHLHGSQFIAYIVVGLDIALCGCAYVRK